MWALGILFLPSPRLARRPSPIPCPAPSRALPCLASGLCFLSAFAASQAQVQSFFATLALTSAQPAIPHTRQRLTSPIRPRLTSPHLVLSHAVSTTSTHLNSSRTLSQPLYSPCAAWISPRSRPATRQLVSHGIVAHLAHFHHTLPVGAPWSLNPPQKLSISPPIRCRSNREHQLAPAPIGFHSLHPCDVLLSVIGQRFCCCTPLRSAVHIISCLAQPRDNCVFDSDIFGTST